MKATEHLSEGIFLCSSSCSVIGDFLGLSLFSFWFSELLLSSSSLLRSGLELLKEVSHVLWASITAELHASWTEGHELDSATATHTAASTSTTSHSLGEHLLKRVASTASAASSSTTTHLSTERLGKDIFDASASEELAEQILWVDVIKIWTTS